MCHGELGIDFHRRLAFVGDQEVRLTPTQYRLFETLMRNAGKIMTHEQILLTVWGPEYTKETQYLRVYMGQLRQKFEHDPARPRYLITEPGVGYRLCTTWTGPRSLRRGDHGLPIAEMLPGVARYVQQR